MWQEVKTQMFKKKHSPHQAVTVCLNNFLPFIRIFIDIKYQAYTCKGNAPN